MRMKATTGISRIAIVLGIIIIIIVAAGGIYFATMTTTTNSLTTINIAVEPGQFMEALYVANSTNIFQSNGIRPVLTVYQSDSAIMTAMAAGQADYTIEFPQIVSNSVSSGSHLKILAAVFTQFTEGGALLVRANSTITSIPQLNGQKVGISAKGSLTDLLAQMVMKKYNISFTEVQLGFSARVPALLSGQVQAIEAIGPQVYQLLQAKQARMLLDDIEFGSSFSPYAVAVTTDTMLQNHPNVVGSLLKATFEAVSYMRNDPQAVYPVLASEMSSSLEIGQWLYNTTMPYLSSNGIFNTTQMVNNIEYQNQLVGSTQSIPPLSDIYTGQFLPVTATATESIQQ